MKRLGATAAGLASCLAAALWVAPGAAASSVAVFPTPGSRVASPQAQIAFRGLPYSQLAAAHITVTGSESGAHTGKLEADSDGLGGSFIPAAPFKPMETVTVNTSLSILGAKRGTFRFTVADPAGPIPFRPTSKVGRVKGDVFQFVSVPTLQPTAITFTKQAGTPAPGDLFLAPQVGPVQYGPEIIDSSGNLVWSEPVPANDEVTDFEAQTYRGQPVLTWWQGNVNAGSGRGVDMILDDHYRQLAQVQAANGLSADLHEFQITPSNTALITAYYPVYWDARSVDRPRYQIVLDSVVQEIDIPTGLVLFQWDSLDHVPLTDSHAPLPPRKTRNPFDFFHVNSVDVDHDGNLIVSARNTWAAYKVDHRSGRIIWTLGGRHSSFRMGRGASFAFQHDVRIRSGHDWFVTIFDDGGGPPVEHPSRGLKLFLDVRHHTAREVSQRQNSPRVQANVEGNYQQLPDRHDVIGWGSGQYFSEFAPNGQLILAGRFADTNYTYRVYRFPWSGSPAVPPAVAARSGGGHTTVYASWNGATAVASWRVLGGITPAALKPVGAAPRQGFETTVTVPQQTYVAVQALDAAGNVLGQSAATHG